jgi:hypothetical protein
MQRIKETALATYWFKYLLNFYNSVRRSRRRAFVLSKSNLQAVKLRLHSRRDIRFFMCYLHSSPRIQLKSLIDIVVIDRPGLLGRFKMNYIIFSPTYVNYVGVGISANEVLTVPSLFSGNAFTGRTFNSSN